MNKTTKGLFVLASLVFNFVFAEMGVPLQLKLKSPEGSYPTASGLDFKLLVLSPTSNCILREENFFGQSITNGAISLNLGSGARGVNDPNLTLNQVYDNSKSKTGLSCVDENNNVILSEQIYNPTISDERIIRITTTINSDLIIANFNMRATPYAIQAESVGGKTAADILIMDANTAVNQTNLNDLLSDVTRFNNLKNIATSGQAITAVNFTGSLTGDISGTQSATSVDRIRGVTVSTTSPTSGDVLRYNGSQYVPSAIPAAPVTSVSGRTGAVVLSNSDIAGLGGAAALNVGTATGTVAAGDDSRIVNALQSSSTFSGDISGTNSTISVDRIRGVAVSTSAPMTGEALVYNGTQWAPTTGFPVFARSTANQTFSATALANVTSLSFTVTSGLVYKYKFHIMYTSAATSTGLRLGLTYPAVTNATALANIASGGDGTGAYLQGLINSSGDSVLSANSPSTTTTLFAQVEGIIAPSANGTVQLQAATEIAASNIVILANSFVEFTVVP